MMTHHSVALGDDGSWEMTPCAGIQMFQWVAGAVERGDRHYSPLFSVCPPPPSQPTAVLQNDSVCISTCRWECVSMVTGELLQRLPQKSLFTLAIVLGDNGCQTGPPPPGLHTTHYTLLHSLGSADRCSVKHALIHKTHPLFACLVTVACVFLEVK